MRVIDALVDLWESAGEPSDLDPWLAAADSYVDVPDGNLDVNSKGVRYYLRQLSRAQTAISNWRKSRGHEVRFKRFIGTGNIKCGLANNEFRFYRYGAYGISVPVTRMPADLPTGDYDIFENAAIKLINKTYTAISGEYDATIAGGSLLLTFYEPITWPVDAAGNPLPYVDGPIYQNWFKIQTNGVTYSDGFYCTVPQNLVEVLKVYDGPSSKRLLRPKNKDSLYVQPATVGTPEQWYIIGDRIYFNTYLEKNRYYKIEYYRMPNALEANTGAALIGLQFEVPAYFHEALTIWVEWQQARRAQEWDKAYAVKKDLMDIIERTSTENSLDLMRDETYGFYVQWEDQ